MSVSLSIGRGEKLPASKGAGLTAKGRAKYNRATGSKLKPPAPNPKTKRDAARKKSFCARMSGAWVYRSFWLLETDVKMHFFSFIIIKLIS